MYYIHQFRFLASFFVVAITAVAAANPHQPAKYVFATFVNETGWSNPFVVFMNGKSIHVPSQYKANDSTGLIVTAGVSLLEICSDNLSYANYSELLRIG